MSVSLLILTSWVFFGLTILNNFVLTKSGYSTLLIRIDFGNFLTLPVISWSFDGDVMFIGTVKPVM